MIAEQSSQPTDTTRMIPALTGLRAVAAYAVFLHHYNPAPAGTFGYRLFAQGYVGVSIFFVLSGFLIHYRYANNVLTGRAWSWWAWLQWTCSWVCSSLFSGLAVFALKHALALAHASRGGKCRLCGKVPCKGHAGGTEEANTWSCTELFPSACARQGRSPSAGLVSVLHAERA